jgi:hypothetical protein
MTPHIQHHSFLQSIVMKYPFKIIEVDYFSFLPLDPVTGHRYNILFNYKINYSFIQVFSYCY